MMKDETVVPKIVVKSVGIGLLLMAVFTMMWNGIATSEFTNGVSYFLTALFSAFSLLFIIYGLYLFRISKKFPDLKTKPHKKKKNKILMWYGIIFGLEGLTIPLAVFLLLNFDGDDYIIPVIALIVGIHFYPMAALFKRKIDYYLATWTCIVSLIGMYMVNQNKSQHYIFIFVGIGVAIATTIYGFYMIYTGRRYQKSLAKL